MDLRAAAFWAAVQRAFLGAPEAVVRADTVVQLFLDDGGDSGQTRLEPPGESDRARRTSGAGQRPVDQVRAGARWSSRASAWALSTVVGRAGRGRAPGKPAPAQSTSASREGLQPPVSDEDADDFDVASDADDAVVVVAESDVVPDVVVLVGDVVLVVELVGDVVELVVELVGDVVLVVDVVVVLVGDVVELVGDVVELVGDDVVVLVLVVLVGDDVVVLVLVLVGDVVVLIVVVVAAAGGADVGAGGGDAGGRTGSAGTVPVASGSGVTPSR
jgi:hypothetical protein